VWLSYARALGGGSIAWLAALYTVSQVLSLGSSYWLARWTDEAHAAADRWFYVYVYAGITLGAAALVWVRVLFVACSSLRVGRRLHDRGLRAVVASPMSFFDATPLSRVLAGFGADLQVRIEIAAHL
jgi:ABC-type multidrug transport system fused ATPase/permease subunit